jgi:hypothetical protein
MHEVVQLREQPLLSDIPGMLRNLADNIESGKYEGCDAVLVVMPIAGDYPKTFGFGDVSGLNDPIIQFELAKHWHVEHLVKR